MFCSIIDIIDNIVLKSVEKLETYNFVMERLGAKMNKKRMKRLGVLLCIVLLTCLVMQKNELSNTVIKAESRTKLKRFTISNKELKKISNVAKKSGSKAAMK